MLVKITARAWSLKILAMIDEGVPARQAPLLAASQASRSAFAASLRHLVDLHLLERNPGHGHPLRPEYRLTEAGVEYAGVAARIMRSTPVSTESGLLRKSWTVPILAVTDRPRYFSEIRTDLGAVTDRALSQSLDVLHQQEWLRRDVDVSQKPLRPMYQATNTGVLISRAIDLRGEAQRR